MATISEVPSISSLDEFKAKIAGDTPVLIDFWATWCGPCRIISPIFKKFSEEVKGVEFYKVDVDAQPDIAQEVQVRAMPTFMLFKRNEKQGELVGAVPAKLQALVATATSLVTSASAKSGSEVGEKPNTSSSAKSGTEADEKPYSTGPEPGQAA